VTTTITPSFASVPEMERAAREVRGTLVDMSYTAKTPHLGSALSCVDILVAAYWGALTVDPARPDAPDRDRIILSKGHAGTTLYAALFHRGYFGRDLMDDYAKPGAALAEHPVYGSAPGIEMSTGSLGHGLSVGLGMALASRIRQIPYRVCVVMSDGECNEGSVWEAAMLAPSLKLENLIVVIDYNKWQATDRSNEVMALSPLRDKWQAFGWNAQEVDGHDVAALAERMRATADGTGRPLALVAHTVKGKGVSFMEDDNNWHYAIPNAEQAAAARKELGLA
jgi:transketolase